MGEICARRAAFAAKRLAELPGCSLRFAGPTFKEFVLQTPVPGRKLVRTLVESGYQAGPALGRWFEDLDDCLLIAVTERRTEQDILGLVGAVEKALADL
jgi:glycine dehydrogenase subunit 1